MLAITTNILQAAMLAVMFLAISHPVAYEISDGLVRPLIGRFARLAVDGSPTLVGILAHAAVFFLAAWGLLEAKERSE